LVQIVPDINLTDGPLGGLVRAVALVAVTAGIVFLPVNGWVRAFTLAEHDPYKEPAL
jgi:hypothetical protein